MVTGTIKTLADGVRDFSRSLSLWRFWVYRARINFNLRFRSTRLGLLWPALSLLLVVAVLGTLWGVIFEKSDSATYYLYLIAGYPVWQFLSGAVNSGARGISSAVQHEALPLTLPAFERLAGLCLALIVVLPIVFLTNIALGNISAVQLMMIPVALIVLSVWSLGVILILMVLITLFPDIRQFVNALMRLAFLATPIIWEPVRLQQYQHYLWFNPFYAPLEFVRFSFSGILHTSDILWVAPIYSFSLLVVGYLCVSRYQNSLRLRAE